MTGPSQPNSCVLMNLDRTIDPSDVLESLPDPQEAAGDASSPPPPLRLGPYEIQDRLGAGAMGVVYRGWDAQLNRHVAVKTLWPKLAADPEARERFLREARAAAALSHPNVTQIYSIGEENGLVFFAMEYLEGRPLQDIIGEKGKLSPALALCLARQAAAGLKAAADRGIIHRDVKPSNLVLTLDGVLKVTDFGLAKQVVSDAGLTSAGQLLGTPNYMSPEQASGTATDLRSDIYSLGATLYEMLTGRPPFRAPTAMAVIMKHISEPVPSLRQVEPDLPYPLAGLVQRMLAKTPGARPQTYDALLQEMERLAPSLGVVDAGGLGLKMASPGATIPGGAGAGGIRAWDTLLASGPPRARPPRPGEAVTKPVEQPGSVNARNLFLLAIGVLAATGLWAAVRTPPDRSLPASSTAASGPAERRGEGPPSSRGLTAGNRPGLPLKSGLDGPAGSAAAAGAPSRADLQIVEKTHEIAADGRLRVMGRISNIGQGRATGSRVRILLTDDAGLAIDSTEVDVTPPVLGPGESGSYEAFFPAPDRGIRIQIELNWLS